MASGGQPSRTRDDLVQAEVVDEAMDDVQHRLERWIFSLESGQVGRDGLLALDDLDALLRERAGDTPRWLLDNMLVERARALYRNLRQGSREHVERAERLDRLAGLVSNHLHAAADGDLPGMDVAVQAPALKRPF